MKVLFLVPNWGLHELKYTTATVKAPCTQPLEFMYIAKLLNTNCEYDFLDANLEGLSWEEIKNEITKYRAEVVIFSTTISYLQWRCPPLDLEVPRKLVEICKELQCISIAIGPHCTVSPEETMETIKVDYMILGEPEITLSQFLNSGMQDDKIKGVFAKGKKITHSDEVDINKLPTPDYSIIKRYKYDSYSWSEKVQSILCERNIKGTIAEFSRGCQFNCIFCLREHFRKEYRRKNLKQMKKEIAEIKAKGYNYIFFIDEIFNIPSEELYELLELLKDSSMLFGCQARPDVMTFEVIDRLKKAGCIYIEYGLESFSESVLKKINKNIDLNEIKRIIAYSYIVFGKENIQLGILNFNTEDIREILTISEKLPLSLKNIRPYPGSYFGEKIFESYGIKEKKWEFAIRYMWWIQIETYAKYFSEENCLDEKLKEEILFGSFVQSKKVSYRILNEYKKKWTKNSDFCVSKETIKENMKERFRSWDWKIGQQYLKLLEITYEAHAMRRKCRLEFFQTPILPETAVRRALLVENQEEKIILMGDDDLTSIPLAVLGFDVTVLDIDESLIDLIKRMSEKYNLQIKIAKTDFLKEMKFTEDEYDVLICDPISTYEAFEIFVGKGMNFLKIGGKGYISVNQRFEKVFLEFCKDYDIEILRQLKHFNNYYDNNLKVINDVADLFIVTRKATSRTTNLEEKRKIEDIYISQKKLHYIGCLELYNITYMPNKEEIFRTVFSKIADKVYMVEKSIAVKNQIISIVELEGNVSIYILRRGDFVYINYLLPSYIDDSYIREKIFDLFKPEKYLINKVIGGIPKLESYMEMEINNYI